MTAVLDGERAGSVENAAADGVSVRSTHWSRRIAYRSAAEPLAPSRSVDAEGHVVRNGHLRERHLPPWLSTPAADRWLGHAGSSRSEIDTLPPKMSNTRSRLLPSMIVAGALALDRHVAVDIEIAGGVVVFVRRRRSSA